MQLLLSSYYTTTTVLSTRLSLRIETSMWSQKSDPQPLSLIDWLKTRSTPATFLGGFFSRCRTFYLFRFSLEYKQEQYYFKPEIPSILDFLGFNGHFSTN